MKIHFHAHHVTPVHAGGSDDPNNLVKVNRAMHSFMHRLRYKETGDYYDCCAANLLSGNWTVEKARREACLEGQRRSDKVLPAALKNITDYNSSTTPEQRSANGLAGSLAQSREDKAKGGKIGGKMPFWNNGLNNKRSHTCPGEGYVPGKLPVGKINVPRGKCPHCDLVTSLNSNMARHISAKHSNIEDHLS
jgi:hypothetical protein